MPRSTIDPPLTVSQALVLGALTALREQYPFRWFKVSHLGFRNSTAHLSMALADLRHAGKVQSRGRGQREVRYRLKCLKTIKGVCRECGCTHDEPCPDEVLGTCAWADATLTLCTACANGDLLEQRSRGQPGA